MARRRGCAVVFDPYLARACELAQRGLGSTSPNPPVGAVIVRDGVTLGEGYHHVRGAPHAEVEALADARARGNDVRGATLFVSLEPCNHHGATPPCTDAIVAAGIARVVIGALDPNPKTNRGGIEYLRASGIEVDLIDDEWARELIEQFSVAIRLNRPYVTLKMAASMDGYVGPKPGSHWLTGEVSRERVRELRFWHDAIMVGAGTVRIDDPLLTVRPPHARRRQYTRVIACERVPVPKNSHVFESVDEYARTIVLAPASSRANFHELEDVGECLFVGDTASKNLDMHAALPALKKAGISSVLCEGGPTIAAALLDARAVDRLVWFVVNVRLESPEAVPALDRDLYQDVRAWDFETVERCGDDLLLTAKLGRDV